MAEQETATAGEMTGIVGRANSGLCKRRLFAKSTAVCKKPAFS